MDTTNQKTITKLRMEYSDLMQEYAECNRRDDILEVKKRILKRMRAIEKEIIMLSGEETNAQKASGNY